MPSRSKHDGRAARAPAILPLALAALVASTALADADPCDPAAGVSYAPGQGAPGLLLVEDLWPDSGDLDFNDQTVAYNFEFLFDSNQNVVEMKASFDLLAVGATLHNGLYLHLALPRATTPVSAVDQAGNPVAPMASETELVFPIAGDTRSLFPDQAQFAGQFVDTVEALPVHLSSPVTLTVTFAQGAALDASQAPFDLFVARSDDFTHQIHQPQFAGTDAMDTKLFGTGDDGSTSAAHFVTKNGLPFAFALPAAIEWPQETFSLDSVYGQVTGFAASGGAIDQDWYENPTDPARAYSHGAGGVAAPVATFFASPELSCAPLAPAIAYVPSADTCTIDTPCSIGAPVSSGGAVDSYAIAPALPAGLALDAATGAISGSASALSTAGVDYTITATNAGGSGTAALNLTVVDAPPYDLTYTESSVSCTTGESCTVLPPAQSGGAVTEYSISPALPDGMSFDSSTGAIAGTPTTFAGGAPIVYTITATNSGGSAQASFSLTLNDAPPAGLSYPASSATCTKGVACAIPLPTESGGGAVVSYSISPALPDGMSFDSSTGAISGTPAVFTGTAVEYTITAVNSGGSAQTTFSLTLDDAPPATLGYAATGATSNGALSFICTLGVPCLLTPSSLGGAVVGYALSGTLPAGLSLDPDSGLLGGTPTALAVNDSVLVTASNSGGSTTATLIITVDDLAPAFSYSPSARVCSRGSPCTIGAPTSTGGTVVAYSLSPIPAGLSINSSTGAISGTPTALSSATVYTVTGANSGGTATAAITLTVNDVAPSISYSPGTLTCSKGVACASSAPSSAGGAVLSYTSAPLPSGLSIDGSTGVVSGTSSALTASAGYTITATNSGGTGTTSLTIAVIDVPPSGMSYSPNSLTCTRGTACSLAAPSLAAGTDVVFSSSGLPAGLAVSSSTGAISGTPTAAFSTATVTVTGTNDAGSTAGTFTLTVNDTAPTALTYSPSSIACYVNFSCSGNAPTNTGGTPTSYAVTAGTLPSGLVVSATTGALSGTATATATVRTITVTASNGYGSTTGTFSVMVTLAPPAGLTYSPTTLVCSVNAPCALAAPTSSGGAIASYSISPALPAGVTLSTTSGALSGAGTVAAAAKSYTVTATNASGTTSASLNITVNNAAPSNLSYIVNCIQGQPCAGAGPGAYGNTPIIYAVTPALPSTLTLSTSTGALSGTPTASLAPTSYTITGTNSIGAGTGTLTLAVNEAVLTAGTGGSASVSYGGTGPTGCALVSGGVQCWGSGTYGALGNNGTTNQTTAPVQVFGLTNGATQISSAGAYSCAVVNGGARCWGNNNWGELGNGNNTASSVPVQVFGLDAGVQAIAAGQGAATCAIVDGNIWCWGYEALGQLGNNVVASAALTHPVQVSQAAGLPDGGATALALGSAGQACAIVNGGAWCWGTNTSGLVGANTSASTIPIPTLVYGMDAGVQAITAGNTNTCAVQNGNAYCWGENYSGSVGNNVTTTTTYNTPQLVYGQDAGDVTAISAAEYQTCDIRNGAVYCWGPNYNDGLGSNAIGTNVNADSLVPVAVTGIPSGATNLLGSWTTNCAQVNGAVECWGQGIDGGPNLTPISPVNGLPTKSLESVSAGSDFTCANVNGGAQCWGDGASGQLGNAGTATSYSPVQVYGLDAGVSALSSGYATSCAIVNGAAQCWGSNLQGALGANNSSIGQSNVPLAVSKLGSGVESISVGSDSTSCAVVSGAAECWGNNSSGQLGNNTTTDSPLPVLAIATAVQSVSVGSGHACALVAGGVKCWGDNSFGQLGDNGLEGQSLVPRSVPALTSGVQSIVSGGNVTCAVVSGATLCWGQGTPNGQLGDNTLVNSFVPVALPSLSGVQLLVSKFNSTCALANGAVQCWGQNTDAQLGDGSTSDSLVPAPVQGLLNNLQGFSIGGTQSCALVGANILCVGSDASGQLGNSSDASSTTPLPVSGLLGL